MLERMYVFYKRIEDRGLGKHDLQTKCLGMRRPLMAHQLYGMYWLHERERCQGNSCAMAPMFLQPCQVCVSPPPWLPWGIYFTRVLEVPFSEVRKSWMYEDPEIRKKHLTYLHPRRPFHNHPSIDVQPNHLRPVVLASRTICLLN